jgi:hypothetical protein
MSVSPAVFCVASESRIASNETELSRGYRERG